MIKASLLLLCATSLIPHLRRRSAAERHLFWVAALAAATVLPLLGLVLPVWQPSWTRTVLAILPPTFDVGATWSAGPNADVIIRANGIESAPWALSTLVWTTGSGAALLLLGIETLKLARLAASARPVDDDRMLRIAREVCRDLGLNRPVRLLVTARSIVPVTWGARRPCVLVPASATLWSDDRMRAVLAHELAHVGRGDWLVHVCAELSCALYWFNPLFWVAKNRACRESEDAADNIVLGLGVGNEDYATHLLEIVRAAQAPARAWSPTIAMARTSQLERRLAALLNAYANRRGATWVTLVAALAVSVLVALPLAAMGSARAGIRVELRTGSLPPIARGTAPSGPDNPATPVQDIRVVGQADTSGSLAPPEVVEYTTPPLYSDEARDQQVEGIVTARARVDEKGGLSAVRVVKGLGRGLDQNALVALRQWHFRPGTRGGAPVAMDVEIDVAFRLRNEAINELIANDMATRVGPGVTPPRVVRVAGLWARQPRKEGTVVLDVIVLEDGTPKIVKILQSLDPELDLGAVRNFEQWRFSPAMKDGRPVKVRVNAEVHFHG